jgi:chemotaxis protein CheX
MAAMALQESKVRESVETVWSSMLGLDIREGGKAPERSRRPDLLTGCVQIAGRWQGAVTLDCSPVLARQIAAIMFGVDQRETTSEMIQDAIGELTNIIGGNVKALLPEPCHLSLPVVTEGSDFLFHVLDSRVVAKLTFTCLDIPFQVTIAQGVG